MKAVIVTGASRGLGRAIALRFGSAGYSVAVNFRERIKEAEDVAGKIEKMGGRAVLTKADVRNIDDISGMIDLTISAFGRIDILINNAAINKDRLLISMDEDDWKHIIDTNLKGAFNCMRAAAGMMAKSGGGHIVNISSFAGLSGRRGQACYAASKAGLIGLSRSAAKELAGSNIMVNVVIPGFMQDGMGKDLSSDQKDIITKDNILGDPISAQGVADFIFHFTSSTGTTGQIFNLDNRVIF
ncbi:MAG: SDR family NAD(P)-dependent oxidoreductase [Nitrospirae bacterium]|nr:SDR family NAD(P)-dependent oxidoreductase [Nitrospirota bacterium]